MFITYSIDRVMKVKMKKIIRHLNARNIAYFYIILPVAIFVLGWTRYYIGIPATLVIAWFFGEMCREPYDETIVWNKRNTIAFIICLLLIGAIIILSGIGGITYQNEDHLYRNRIFETLVNKSWPVYFTSNDGNNLGLCYYFGFWLPSAVVGKLFGLSNGYLFQILYAFLGVGLVAYFIFNHFKEISLAKLLGFFLFSGLDIIGYLIVNNESNINLITHLEWWAELYEYSSFSTQLFWVFNQAIMSWVVTLLLFAQDNNHYVIFISSALLISGTLPTVGLVPYIVYIIFSDCKFNKRQSKNIYIKELLTPANIVGGGIIGIISIMFLSSNRAVTSGSSLFAIHSRRDLILYLAFVFIEVGAYILLIFDKEYNNILFWITTLVLMVCPLVRVGEGHDFCMRASIPALMVLYLMVMETLQKYYKEKNYLRFSIILVVLFIGAFTPALEYNRTIYTEFTYNEYTSYDKFKNKSNGNGQGLYMIDKRESASEKELLEGLNFTCNVNDNIFYR